MPRQAARRQREPFRILIASDPKRPVRAIVIPRALPRVALVATIVLVLYAGFETATSLRLGGHVDRLQGRVTDMVHAAESVAQHPLGESMAGAALAADARVRVHKP